MTEEKPSPDDWDKNKKKKANKSPEAEKEIGGYKDNGLLEPTRFGDWDVKGRCCDF